MYRDALRNFDNTLKPLLFISEHLCILPAILGSNSCPRNSLRRAHKGNDRERDPSDTNSTSTYRLFCLDEMTSNILPFTSFLPRLLQFHLWVNLSLLPTTSCHYLLCLMQGHSTGDYGKCGSSSTSHTMVEERGVSWWWAHTQEAILPQRYCPLGAYLRPITRDTSTSPSHLSLMTS